MRVSSPFNRADPPRTGAESPAMRVFAFAFGLLALVPFFVHVTTVTDPAGGRSATLLLVFGHLERDRATAGLVLDYVGVAVGTLCLVAGLAWLGEAWRTPQRFVAALLVVLGAWQLTYGFGLTP